MVHGMDALSAKWRDDPVRAALEKKKNREAAADRMAQANAMASEILKKKLASTTSSRAMDDEGSSSMNDADYRLVCSQPTQRHARAPCRLGCPTGRAGIRFTIPMLVWHARSCSNDSARS